jgi:cell division protein FtsI/penicillin-binding protein 2
MRFKKNKEKKLNIDNRIHLVIAIIFLLGAAIIFRLYNIQVNKHDYYASLAAGQQQVFSQLMPLRGNIYYGDRKAGLESRLYPLATNKEFYSVYAVPKDIKDSGRIAEILYQVFDEEDLIKEVNKHFEDLDKKEKQAELNYINSLSIRGEEKEQKIAEVEKRYEWRAYDKVYLELLEIKKQKMMEERKAEIIENQYLSKLNKKNDPYELINNKVEEDKLIKLYAKYFSGEERQIKESEIEIKNKRIYILGRDVPEKLDEIAFHVETFRFYPEKETAAHILGFVRGTRDEKSGSYGLEGFFDDELTGVMGSVKSEKDVNGNIIIVNDREYIKPINGSDLILTIDRTLQYNACEKLKNATVKYGAEEGTVIIMKPSTGEILAMCSYPDFDPNNFEKVDDIYVFNNPSVFTQYEPGSVFKSITLAAALDQEKITPSTTYTDHGTIMIPGWPKPIRNSDFATFGAHGLSDMNTVLELSLNTGAIFAMQQIGAKKFSEYVKNFGFGERTGIEMTSEARGDIRNLLNENIKQIDAAVASFGQGISVTPLQMVSSFAAIANNGILMKPYIVKEIIDAEGNREITQPRQIRRVISEKASLLASGMMVNVVEKGHAKGAAVPGYYIAGKTGTAQKASSVGRGYGHQTVHTFVGYGPVENPEFVMLVRFDSPTNVRFAASSAAPLFGEIAEFLLKYYEIPKDR